MRSILISLFLLAGCASAPQMDAPAESLLWDCPVPETPARTNGELATSLQKMKQALRYCNDDKAALRQFYGVGEGRSQK